MLTADIDLTGRDWTPIGTATNTYSDYIAYGGVFDGNGKTISGLSIDNTKKYQAFIGYAKGAEVKALTISGSLKTSDQYAAGIVAYGNPVTITDCMKRRDSKLGKICGRYRSIRRHRHSDIRMQEHCIGFGCRGLSRRYSCDCDRNDRDKRTASTALMSRTAASREDIHTVRVV